MRLVFSALVMLVAVLSLRLVRRYVVDGRSMLRAYAPGDRLVLEGLSYKVRPPRIGEVVVVRQPGTGGRLDLKRITAGPGGKVTVRGEPRLLSDEEWYVLGDNLDESTDSRQLGPILRREIVGRVWFRY